MLCGARIFALGWIISYNTQLNLDRDSDQELNWNWIWNGWEVDWKWSGLEILESNLKPNPELIHHQPAKIHPTSQTLLLCWTPASLRLHQWLANKKMIKPGSKRGN